ncbi:MAG TPA: thioredoxin-disulfide reductase [Candidatus Dormibacteraeota bacterium]|nr:thioredoxin-disulfide reductase [Candidatus Dormibacteraeota bacterium]
MKSRDYEIAIVGAGPAGLTAALYAGRALKRTVLLEAGIPGGELLNTETIEDYPGFVSITGPDLASKMTEHALSFGAEMVPARVSSISLEPDGKKRIAVEDGEPYFAKAVILTAGGQPRKLDVVGEQEYAGRGVSYCAVCDGAFFKGEHLAVVGGGDAALEEAAFLTRYASKVTVIHRRKEFRAQPVLVERARKNPKMEFVLDSVVEEVIGDGQRVEALRLRHLPGGEGSTLTVGGVFIFIGFLPNSGLLAMHADHDSQGYYLTDSNMQTSVPGIYAAGDVRAQLTRQVTTAVGDATTAAMAATKLVEEPLELVPNS